MQVKDDDWNETDEKCGGDCRHNENGAEYTSHRGKVGPAGENKLLVNSVHVLRETIDYASNRSPREKRYQRGCSSMLTRATGLTYVSKNDMGASSTESVISTNIDLEALSPAVTNSIIRTNVEAMALKLIRAYIPR